MRHRGIGRHEGAILTATISALLAFACRSVETQGAGGAASSASASTHASSSSHVSGASGVGGGLATITFSAQVVRSPQGAPLSAVNVCVLDHPDLPCVMTDAQGAFDLTIPAKAETAVTLAKTGSAGVLVPIVTTDKDTSGYVIGLPVATEVSSYYQVGGEAYPQMGKGFLAVYATTGNTQNGKDGVTVTTTPAATALYANASGAPDASLQATSLRGLVRFGDLSPGVMEVVLTSSGLCDSNFGGWPSQQPHAARMPIAEGFETHVGFGCF